MCNDLKLCFFIATIESILLYGCESWTLTEALEKSLDGTYTRMLRKAQNIHWSSHTPNEVLYGKLPKVSDKIASRRIQLAGHCYRHPELCAHPLILLDPSGSPNTDIKVEDDPRPPSWTPSSVTLGQETHPNWLPSWQNGRSGGDMLLVV